MPIKKANNDQNIERVLAKMTEECSGPNNNIELTDAPNDTRDTHYLNNVETIKTEEDPTHTYDHIYTPNSPNSVENSNPAENCQSAESEVKFLKEWLLLHLDLIQQQNDEILSKDNIIFSLKQENAMLKERLNCLDKGIVYSPNHSQLQYTCKEEMIEDAEHIDDDDEDNQSGMYCLDTPDSNLNNCEDLENYVDQEELSQNNEIVTEEFSDSSCHNMSVHCDEDLEGLRESAQITTIKEEETSENIKLENSTLNETINNSILNLNNSDYLVNNSVDDSLKTLRMNIRRNRLCSSSSALSNNDNVDDSKIARKRKKRKHIVKDEKILTSDEQYVTLSSEASLGIASVPDRVASVHNLEVPRWRVKVYTSCYAMEGTENLDDEVFNKRHLRLEMDERRIKRWDVQRIREQRMVEKLKQRQERVASSSKSDDHSDPVHSLWPTVEDIRQLEICDQLPVSAFGAPVLRFSPSEFSLPWLNNPQASFKKTNNRKSTVRRKAAKR